MTDEPKISPKGEIELSRQILEMQGAVDFYDLTTFEESVVLAGRRGNDAIVVRLDPAGGQIWSKVVSYGDIRARFTDILPMGNEIVVVGWGIDFKQPRITALIAKIGENGELVSEKVFDATPYVGAAKTGEQKFAVSYSLERDGLFSTRVREYDADLNQLDDAMLLNGREKAQRYQISPMGSGLVIAGCDWTNLNVVRVGDASQVVEEYRVDAMNYSMCHTQLVVVDDEAVIFVRSAGADESQVGTIRGIALDMAE